ncbi:AKT-interacting protein-like isoform X2 [Tubulanus polymorphus]|uniref:AKT-interacting protein-like isoform X2 n=1 Tax=Tubulanus polymorphus TaxID=672921 RepID=UPI003DA55DF2
MASSNISLENGAETPPSTSSLSRQNSLGKKTLPSIPDSQAQLQLASKMIDKKTSTPKGNHSYGPFFLEYSLLAEYHQLQKQRLPGVYVIPSAKSSLLWFGVLFIRQGLYQDGVFKFSLIIPENYPDGDCPRLKFDVPIFHPCINPETGELDCKRAFQKWRRNVNHISQVLLYARRVFYKIDNANPLNPEAAVLYDKDGELYKRRVYESIQICKEKLYDAPSSDDPHSIRFSQWDPSIHEDVRKQMLQPKKTNDGSKSAQTSGLSWMKSDSMDMFSISDNKDESGS